MSDYGDDYSDYGEEWFYVEDEYMAADDLAEHAVASPPPTTYGDEDMLPEWDRFDYFNDLEYASDGYDDATFQAHNANDAKAGQKRKRTLTTNLNHKKRLSSTHVDGRANVTPLGHSPVVWRSRADRETKLTVLDDNAPSYALLKDWREKLEGTPYWARGSPPANSSDVLSSKASKAKVTFASDIISPDSELNEEKGLDDEEDGGMDIDPEALMAVLQSRLTAAGGPLNEMDPQQLLQFAMRMATGKDDGDDIAGEMTDAMLGQGEGGEEDDTETEANLLSWVAQQRNSREVVSSSAPKSQVAAHNSNRPPTPPLSEANHSVHVSNDSNKAGPLTKTANAYDQENSSRATRSISSLKRKADEEVNAETSFKATKRRATRSFDAPTAASQARAVPAKARRSGRSKYP